MSDLLNSYIKRERKVKNSLTNNGTGSIEVISSTNQTPYYADVLLDTEVEIPYTVDSEDIKEFIPMTWGFILKLSDLTIKYRWS
jgi:hypothetical protein